LPDMQIKAAEARESIAQRNYFHNPSQTLPVAHPRPLFS
jgi:hypothetical protein